MSRLFILIALLIVFSCQVEHKEFNNWRDFQSYLFNPANGATVSKSIKGIKISATFFPKSIVDARMKKKQQRTDSEEQTFRFILTFKSINSQSPSLAQHAYVRDLDEYRERIEWLNFKLSQYMSLHIDGKVVKPELYTLDSNIDDHSKLSFFIVFVVDGDNGADDPSQSDEVMLRFDDRVFMTGVNNLIFSEDRISEIRSIEIKNI